MKLLTLDAVTVKVGQKTVCQDLSLHIRSGERWAVLGVNGVGKTTLLHTLTGLRPPVLGSLRYQGESLGDMAPRRRACHIGLMSQDDEFAAETTVLEAALLGRLPHQHWWQGESASDFALAREALRRVGLEAAFHDRLALTLSGGERRRVALATLLVQDAPLLILDEPTSHLDLHQQVALLDRLCSLEGHTLIMSLHDVNLATRYCTHALLLFGDGHWCGGPIAALLDAAVLTRLYGHDIRAHASAQGPIYLPA